jgi:hypothetical protein
MRTMPLLLLGATLLLAACQEYGLPTAAEPGSSALSMVGSGHVFSSIEEVSPASLALHSGLSGGVVQQLGSGG